jgi:two-component system, cell cycle sensor histidine kinase and response regulator CckA
LRRLRPSGTEKIAAVERQRKQRAADLDGMATQDLSETPRTSVDRLQRRGSIGMVLLVAVVLVGAAVALLFIGRARAEPYIVGLLTVLAVIGVFSMFAIAAGILRLPGNEVNPLIKAITDTAADGLVVTDPAGRVVYANATYLDLVDAVDSDDVRPVERVFVGDPDVSEAVYRLAKAAREGRRLQEEVRVPGLRGEAAR